MDFWFFFITLPLLTILFAGFVMFVLGLFWTAADAIRGDFGEPDESPAPFDPRFNAYSQAGSPRVRAWRRGERPIVCGCFEVDILVSVEFRRRCETLARARCPTCEAKA